MLNHFQLMSQYNQWMNDKLYSASATLSEEILAKDQGAFFKSILGTLNHIMVGDTIWLKRFAEHPSRQPALDSVRNTRRPDSLNQLIYTDIDMLSDKRKELDQIIIDWCQQITEEDLSHDISFSTMKGDPFTKSFGSLVLHFFNHQTHHRGQATTLLSQHGVDVGVTDLLVLIPNYEMA